MKYLTIKHRKELLAIIAECSKLTGAKPERICRSATKSQSAYKRLQNGRLLDSQKIKIEQEIEKRKARHVGAQREVG